MEQANNVSQFLNLLKRYNNYPHIFYRGQSAQYESITSSIARNQGYLENEYAIYKESISMKKDEFRTFNYPIEHLSKLQHYGIPTRLIDVTVNPLIALFFAIQDVPNKQTGFVYVYIRNYNPIDSKHVRLLSLLATLKDYNLNVIKESYQKQFNDVISETEILTMAQEPTFIEYTEALKESNGRLYNQQGTFAICGNEVVNDSITHQIKPLDSIKPVMVICIPYEYKTIVKHELDEYYGINEPKIYPELPAIAEYIKEKYKSEPFSIEGTYSVMETQNISHSGARRISITIKLENKLSIDQIKQIGISVIEKYKSNNDVIWLYIARNNDDYVTHNWILRGQWINPIQDSKFRPIPIREVDNYGYSWDEGEAYNTIADFNNRYVFDDDKNLFVYHQKIFEMIRPLFFQLYSLSQLKSLDEFIYEANKQKESINQAC